MEKVDTQELISMSAGQVVKIGLKKDEDDNII